MKRNQIGFTLVEILVSLFILATALGASLRAIGSLTQNNNDLRIAIMSTWSAENRLTKLRLTGVWPALGETYFPCPQGAYKFQCKQRVSRTPNPLFRRVDITVFSNSKSQKGIAKLSQLIPYDI